MRLLTIIFILFLCILLSNCANVVTPTGGTKDEIPPQPIAYIPDSATINFKSKEIEIKFNEFIQISDLFNQVVISPPMEKMPDFKVKGKSLLIKLTSPLNDSTTYTINFGNGIKDITEGNPVSNFTYVFSTGDKIDSLELSGNIMDPLNNTPSDKSLAVLYPDINDSLFTTEKPYYFAKADPAGFFKIRHIKAGRYRLYAIEDQNFNYYYDLPNEKISFMDTAIQIDSSVNGIKLKLFSENKINQQLLEAKSYRYGNSVLIFSNSIDTNQIKYVGESDNKGFFTSNKTNDTIEYWNTDIYLDRHIFNIKYDTIDTVLEISVKGFPKDSNFVKNKNSYYSSIYIPRKGESKKTERTTWDLNKDIFFTFSNPLKNINSDSFYIYINDTLKEKIFPIVKIDDKNTRRVILQYNWNEAKNYNIHVGKNATRDIFNLTNDSSAYYITTRKATDYGKLILNITNTTSSQLILQLLSRDNIVLKENIIPTSPDKKNTPVVIYEYLSPATYKLRCITDANNNLKWDTGNLFLHLQPEQVTFYETDIPVRANWDNEINWEIK